jgi:hypothetical protein
LGSDNKIVDDNQLSIVFSVANGSFRGSFVDPADGKKRTLKGVALPNQQQGRGFFLGSDQGGRVLVTDQPGQKEIALIWTQSASPDVTTNRIYRSKMKFGPYSLIASVSATTRYRSDDLPPNRRTVYYYVVTAVNSAGVESPPSNPAAAHDNRSFGRNGGGTLASGVTSPPR